MQGLQNACRVTEEHNWGSTYEADPDTMSGEALSLSEV